MPRPPRCLIDRTRACNSCIAPSPRECPYAFLLADAATLDRWTASVRTSGPADLVEELEPEV